MPRLRVYISADYDPNSGDRNVVDLLNKWGDDAYHKVDFVDTAKVKSGSVSKETDCRICDLKDEFNRQIKASSYVIFVIGDKTASRTAGSSCDREDKEWIWCECTPYGENVAGRKTCKKRMREVYIDDVDCVNSYSYIKHEFEEAVMREKSIIILYNSLYKMHSWLPDYMSDCECIAEPFWVKNNKGEVVGNYEYIKQALGYE